MVHLRITTSEIKKTWVQIPPLPPTVCPHGSGLSFLSFCFLLRKMETAPSSSYCELSGSFGKEKVCRGDFSRKPAFIPQALQLSLFSPLWLHIFLNHLIHFPAFLNGRYQEDSPSLDDTGPCGLHLPQVFLSPVIVSWCHCACL